MSLQVQYVQLCVKETELQDQLEEIQGQRRALALALKINGAPSDDSTGPIPRHRSEDQRKEAAQELRDHFRKRRDERGEAPSP